MFVNTYVNLDMYLLENSCAMGTKLKLFKGGENDVETSGAASPAA